MRKEKHHRLVLSENRFQYLSCLFLAAGINVSFGVSSDASFFSIFRMFSLMFEELQFNLLQNLYFGDDTTNVRVVFNLDESICLVVRQKGMVLAVLCLATVRIGRLQK